MYPKNDVDFEELEVKEVTKEKSGAWSILRVDGWSFYVPADSPVTPVAGMTARFYGAGIGSSVRGLFLNGEKVFYRTKEEDKEHTEIELYGADAADWLARWDEGKSVFTIEMGGMGPGYEQCIHITCAEILRHLLETKYDHAQWSNEDTWHKDRDAIEKYGFANAVIDGLGLSGAQWGAALHLACKFYMRGPRSIMKDEKVKDRRIQVSKTFPAVVAA